MNTWIPIDYDYDNLHKDYDFYTWDPNIGEYGAFRYKKDDNIIDVVISDNTFNDIKIFKRCIKDNYLSKEEVLGLGKTKNKIFIIPSNIDYGWDYNYKCWVYYTNKTNKPAFCVYYNPI